MRKSFLSRDKWDSHPTYLCEFTIPRALRLDGDKFKYKEKKQQEGSAAGRLKRLRGLVRAHRSIYQRK